MNKPTAFATTPGGRIAEDDQFTYKYDGEGNLIKRTSKFETVRIDDLNPSVSIVAALVSPTSEVGAFPIAAPQQQFAGNYQPVEVNVTFPQLGEGVYDLWSTWQEYSHLGRGRYSLNVVDDVARATSVFDLPLPLVKDETNGMFVRSNNRAVPKTRIEVDFSNAPGGGSIVGVKPCFRFSM